MSVLTTIMNEETLTLDKTGINGVTLKLDGNLWSPRDDLETLSRPQVLSNHIGRDILSIKNGQHVRVANIQTLRREGRNEKWGTWFHWRFCFLRRAVHPLMHFISQCTQQTGLLYKTVTWGYFPLALFCYFHLNEIWFTFLWRVFSNRHTLQSHACIYHNGNLQLDLGGK